MRDEWWVSRAEGNMRNPNGQGHRFGRRYWPGSPTEALIDIKLGAGLRNSIPMRQWFESVLPSRRSRAGAIHGGLADSPMWVRMRSIGALGERPLSVAFLPEDSAGRPSVLGRDLPVRDAAGKVCFPV